MTDKIIKFQKPVDLHKELHFRMNVVSTAEKIFIKLSLADYEWNFSESKQECAMRWAKMFHEIAQLYIDDIMNKIEKESK
jgi:hypothetical protein